MRLLPILLLALFAGCLGAEAPPEESHIVGGRFVRGATSEQIREAGDLARAEGGDMELLMMDPPAFVAFGFGKAGCERFRLAAMEKPYIARVGECVSKAAFDARGAPAG